MVRDNSFSGQRRKLEIHKPLYEAMKAQQQEAPPPPPSAQVEKKTLKLIKPGIRDEHGQPEEEKVIHMVQRKLTAFIMDLLISDEDRRKAQKEAEEPVKKKLKLQK